MPKKISEIRRAEIVQALHEAIAAQGIALPSYDHVAREGDMSRQLVRHYYRDPEEMALDLCEHLAASYRDHLMRGILHAPPEHRLTVFLDFYFGQLEDKGLPKPADDAVYDALFAYANASERVRECLRDQYVELRLALANEILLTYPDMSQKACRELAYLVVTQMYGHWKMRASLGMKDADSGVARRAIDRLIASYVRQDADPDTDAHPERKAGAHAMTDELEVS